MTRDAAMAHLETYLDQVRRRLRALPDAESEEVLKELRSHVLDRVEGQLTPRSVEAALDALGSPAEVARLNVTERAIVAVDGGSAPLRVLRAFYRIATVSALGVFAFSISLVGYLLAFGFLMVAVLKPFLPQSVGFWRTVDAEGGYQYAFGTVDHAMTSQELLGWWIIPIALVVGGLLAYLTWRLGVGALRRMGRSARRTRGSAVEFA